MQYKLDYTALAPELEWLPAEGRGELHKFIQERCTKTIAMPYYIGKQTIHRSISQTIM